MAAGTIEMPADAAKRIVSGFLANWFAFDPNTHVRSGHNAAAVAAALAAARPGGVASDVVVDTADPGHLTVAALRAPPPAAAAEHADALAVLAADPRGRSAVLTLLRDADLGDAALTALAAPDAFMAYLGPVPAGSAARPAADITPPQDTFHRWAYYTEVNYEELRTVTEAIYPERPDLDWALALWDVFEGTSADVDAQFEKYCQRYADEVPSAIKALEFGSWSLIADFKKNRDKIQFYNRHTDVLKRILDRHAEDKRLGADLMRNRVRAAKAKNIAEDGPDAPGLAMYRRNVAERGQDLGAKGVEKVITPEEMKRLEKARGNVKAAKELEVLDQLQRTIANFAEIAAYRPLTPEESSELARAKDDLVRAQEMIAVPDDAIQVDVFTSNPATGEFAKSHFYTASEELTASAATAATSAGSAHPLAQQAVLQSVAKANAAGHA